MEGDGVDVLVLLSGRAGISTTIPRTISLHYWLLGYHFTDTLMLFSRHQVVMLCSHKKNKLLLKLPAAPEGLPTFHFIAKEKQPTALPAQIQDILHKYFPEAQKIATYAEEADVLRNLEESEPARTAMEAVDEWCKGKQLLDRSAFSEQVRAPYDILEAEFIGTAGLLGNMYTRKMWERILNHLARGEAQTLTDAISKDIEKETFQDPNLWNLVKTQFPHVVREQGFSLMHLVTARVGRLQEIWLPRYKGVPSGQWLVQKGLYYVTAVTRYQEYFAESVRTYVLNLNHEAVQDAYARLLKVHQFFLDGLKPGVELGELHARVYGMAKDLGFNLNPLLGYGIGALLRMNSRDIVAGSTHVVQPGQCYALRTVAEAADLGPEAGKMHLALGDTVLLERADEGNTWARKVLTEEASKQADDVIVAEVEQQPGTPLDSGDDDVVDHELLRKTSGRELRKRLRDKADNVERERKREVEQALLRNEKLVQLEMRVEAGSLGVGEKSTAKRELGSLKAYAAKKDFEGAKLKRGQLQLDAAHDAVILPIGDKLVPVHLGMLKNVSKHEEAVHSVLRLNFFTPETQGLQGGVVVQCPEAETLWRGAAQAEGGEQAQPQQQPVYIKELIFRSWDKEHFNTLFKALREAIKKIRMRELEHKTESVPQPPLSVLHGKRVKLSNVTMRPSLTNRKVVGSLEIHENGFRFIPHSDKGGATVVDVVSTNIKHRFFQPASEDVLIVIVHFHLREPLALGNKKRTADLQFYREVTAQFDDIGGGAVKRRGARSAANRTDFDEVELERQEREYKKKLNSEFRNFCRAAQEQHDARFEKPERGLGFYGVPQRSNMFLMPTFHCLVALSEMPFFVLTLEEVDLVHFERVNYSSKSFDMTLVFQDLTTWKRICNIPIASLEPLKDWANEKRLLYSEGAVNMNWANILAEIREDPAEFVNGGGWNFLFAAEGEDEEGDEEGGPGGGMMDDGDSSFSASSDQSDNDSEDYSSEEESDAESSDFEPESLDEEGLSWDELEKQAVNEERQARAPSSNRKQGRR